MSTNADIWSIILQIRNNIARISQDDSINELNKPAEFSVVICKFIYYLTSYMEMFADQVIDIAARVFKYPVRKTKKIKNYTGNFPLVQGFLDGPGSNLVPVSRCHIKQINGLHNSPSAIKVYLPFTPHTPSSKLASSLEKSTPGRAAKRITLNLA